MKMVQTAIIMILLSGTLHAQEGGNTKTGKPYTTDEIVISSDGYIKPLTSTIGGIGIITSDTIMKRDPVSVTDALQDITGVYKSSDSSWGSEVSIRGAARDKVIMLIDGSRMNTATDIGAQFGTINPASVEKIEVLKGPVSSLYGSGSIGGVVNVFTRTGKFSESPMFESGVSVSGESNAEGYNTCGFTSYNNPLWYIFGSGSFRNHDNYRDGDNTTIPDSGFNDASGTVNLGFKPSEGHTIELRTQYYEGWDIGIPGAKDSVPVTASGAEYTSVKRALVSLDYTIIPDSHHWLESKLHLYWQFTERDVRITNPPMKIEPGADHNTAGIQWTSILAYGNNTVVAGVDLWTRRISSDRRKTNINTGVFTEDTPLPDASYVSAGVFAEDDIKFNNLTFNLGARGDSIYVSNDKTYKTVTPPSSIVIWEKKDLNEYSWNGHAGVLYDFRNGLTTGILAASGYRAASLEERFKYIALGTTEHWGNPDLKPERSFFFEYAIHYTDKKVKANGSVYRNTLYNLIADVQTGTTQYQLRNISEAQIYGAEYDITIALTGWMEAYNNLSAIRGEDKKSNEDLPSIAPLRSVTGAKFKAGYGISSFIDATYTAAQTRVPAGAEKSDSWSRIDAGLSWRLPWGDLKQNIYITFTNLMDKTYYDYLTMSKNGYVFNEPGRSVKYGYSVIF